jgi:hypothetical protein
MWQRIFVYRIRTFVGNILLPLLIFMEFFQRTSMYWNWENTTIRGQNKSASSGLLSSFAIQPSPVAGDNSRYKRPPNKADNSPPFSLSFRRVGALPPRLAVPSLARCVRTVTTRADTSCTKSTYKASYSADRSTQSQRSVNFKVGVFIQIYNTLKTLY